jgi:hypothetical protein
MVSLKDQIDTAQRYLRQMQMRVREQEQLVEELENRRAYCKHQFSRAVKGYEHEGGYCTECGINELYAPTHKKMVESLG